MSKGLSLLFAVLGTLCFIGVGIALSYRSLWVALLMIVLAIVLIGIGFITRARLRR